jgi:hypothetical protein
VFSKCWVRSDFITGSVLVVLRPAATEPANMEPADGSQVGSSARAVRAEECPRICCDTGGLGLAGKSPGASDAGSGGQCGTRRGHGPVQNCFAVAGVHAGHNESAGRHKSRRIPRGQCVLENAFARGSNAAAKPRGTYWRVRCSDKSVGMGVAATLIEKQEQKSTTQLFSKSY